MIQQLESNISATELQSAKNDITHSINQLETKIQHIEDNTNLIKNNIPNIIASHELLSQPHLNSNLINQQ